MNITLSGRGQFTLNKGFLEHLGVKPTEQVSINKMPDGKLEISAKKDKWTACQARISALPVTRFTPALTK
jgi:bifunctional DNA-binding transcriptional regulator/antitoxin component of YhaV-PrlF toxin-antitoxin module